MRKPKKNMIVIATAISLQANAGFVLAEMDEEKKKSTVKVDAIEVKGILPDRLESVPGAYFVVDEKQLNERRPFSIQEALNTVPGINVVSENTFGLGVNIGVRGLNPRRTSRTLLMEDGMPLFLAPYGDPAAHYTTPLERVQRIEVVKGSGQILYGPQTVGGMINFVTRPVPNDGKVHGTASAMLGNNDFTSLYGNIGAGDERGGLMIDALHKKGDGIRDNHDFEIQEYTAKGQLNLSDRHTLIAKASYFREDSHVSETGLGLVEYHEDKYQAPTGKNDVFEHERKTFQLQHLFQINNQVKLSTQAYYAKSDRASFRQINDPGTLGGRSVMDRCTGLGVATEANAEQCGGRWRPREYEYWGIEPRLDLQHSLFGIESNAVVGFRYHREDIARNQYRGSDPRIQSQAYAEAFGDHREQIHTNVEAKSYYAQNTFYVGDWTFTPGLRVEDLRIKTDIRRAEGAAQNNPESKATNNQTKVLPGFGLTWNGIENTTLFAGVHKGFAPPRPDRDINAPGGANTAVVVNTRPEESTNWELGMRSQYFNGVSLETTLFHTVFDDIVVNGLTTGTFINGGKSEHSGIEFAGRVDFGRIYNTSHNFYISGSYTNLFTAEFKKTNAGASIQSGDRLPYAPKHLASLNVGYQHPIGLDARIGVDYVSEQEEDVAFRDGRSSANVLRGVTGDIPAYALINATVNYKPVGSQLTYFASAYNLGDREYLASRVDGMVAGRQRQVFAGIRYDF
ncbi:TonB-dependent receptor [Methylophilus aquaticus]|uniref:TonB-dependent receptor n=2 Tax=Methylophilus aquaticus TaxID=1971610 RepID=A0ABT9JTR2_9PROT|nr:TonB-dependent receptor [Methylophilus aquaticus]MDP8567505.1 TonB-dependent receptor [Methylophilus aquaticus]